LTDEEFFDHQRSIVADDEIPERHDDKNDGNKNEPMPNAECTHKYLFSNNWNYRASIGVGVLLQSCCCQRKVDLRFPVALKMQLAACSLQLAACSLQLAACSLQHAEGQNAATSN
jgi:hypothetical protein